MARQSRKHSLDHPRPLCLARAEAGQETLAWKWQAAGMSFARSNRAATIDKNNRRSPLDLSGEAS